MYTRYAIKGVKISSIFNFLQSVKTNKTGGEAVVAIAQESAGH
jgi:hypothetical protein